MGCRRRRTRVSALSVGIATALFLSGCGSGAERRAAPRPTLPRAVALRLAHASDGVAAALAAGDNCRALTLAQALRQQASAAVDAASVPPVLRPPLRAATNDLARRIECIPPPPAAAAENPPQGDEGHGKGKHKGKKKHGKEHD
jgi:hypothetical protein